MAEGNAIQLTDSPEVIGVEVTALALKKRVQDLDTKIKLFAKIATAEQYEQVADIGREAATAEKEATEFYAEEVGNLHRLWKAKTEERASIANPAEAIKRLAARLCGEWQQEQERQRQAEIRRLEEEERQKAETALLEEAAALEKEGRAEEAEALIEAPVMSAPVNVASKIPKLSGVSAPRGRSIAVVTSLPLLVKAIADGKVPIQAIEANQSFLNNQARALGTNLAYPGVTVKQEASSAFRRK